MSNSIHPMISLTAKYFGISPEKAAEMLKLAAKRNEQTHAKGLALEQSVKDGKFAKGGIWA